MIIFQTSREGIVHSAFVSDAVPVHRVVRAVEFKMATGCKFLSLAASLTRGSRHLGLFLRQFFANGWGGGGREFTTE